MRDMSENAAKSLVLALTSVASFMVALDALVVTTALSTIRLDLGASIEALEWTVNGTPRPVSGGLLALRARRNRIARRTRPDGPRYNGVIGTDQRACGAGSASKSRGRAPSQTAFALHGGAAASPGLISITRKRFQP
jgi:hypothetical protein